MWSVWLVSCDCGFHSVCPLMHEEETCGSFLMGETDCGENRVLFWWAGPCPINHQSNFLCVPSLFFGLRSNYGRGNDTTAGLCWPTLPPETPGHSQASLAQSLVRTLLLSPGSWCTQHFVRALKSLFPQACGSSAIKSHWPPKSNSLGVLSPFARFPGWEICCGF